MGKQHEIIAYYISVLTSLNHVELNLHVIMSSWSTFTAKVKGKGKGLHTCYSAAYLSTAVLYNLGSGSWLAWASGTAAHYSAIHCLQ